MIIEENKSLREYNTFGIDVQSKYFCIIEKIEDLREALEDFSNEKRLILGGGSNVLFTKNFDGLLLLNRIKGKKLLTEDDEHVYVQFGAGENWHNTVRHCIDNEWAGIENLSLIPGSCGAAPMQNIGAYGVEIKEVFHQLEAFHIESGEIHQFTIEDCAFAYRESVFKRKLSDQYFILNVTLRLNKKPLFNISYGAIQAQLESMGVNDLSIRAISEAVIAIRQRKLPDPNKIGNAGSFFKNPVISKSAFDQIKSRHSDIPHYPAPEGNIKLAAGWLIDQAGWKGKTFESFGVHKNQALVLVNYNNAKGSDIYSLSEEILNSIQEKFNISLEREVNIY
ncbi:MAG: UDP-N-acetylmuramate dehydrogenase [Bacteroidota bacterium]